jgi:hypothetical protein
MKFFLIFGTGSKLVLISEEFFSIEKSLLHSSKMFEDKKLFAKGK